MYKALAVLSLSLGESRPPERWSRVDEARWMSKATSACGSRSRPGGSRPGGSRVRWRGLGQGLVGEFDGEVGSVVLGDQGAWFDVDFLVALEKFLFLLH